MTKAQIIASVLFSGERHQFKSEIFGKSVLNQFAFCFHCLLLFVFIKSGQHNFKPVSK